MHIPDPDTVALLAKKFPDILRRQETPLPCATQPGLFDADSWGKAKNGSVVSARILCWQCPVIRACVAYACHERERGIWGGTTESERRLAGYPPKSHWELSLPARTASGGL